MHRLSSLFAFRYLFSKKSHSVINIISGVSSFAVGMPVAAMVILLSVFNGFEGLVQSMYNDFDPDIIITPAEGKTFEEKALDRSAILSIEGVRQLSSVMEENALIEYRGRQFIATIRGVDSLYSKVVPIEKMVREGEYRPVFGDMEQALVGQGIAYNLGIRHTLFDRIYVYAPRRSGNFSSLLPLESFNKQSLFPSGTFVLDVETDSKYIITPISFTQSLFDYPQRVTAVMVGLEPGADPDRVRGEIASATGGDYRVKTRYQQKASLYKIMAYEKWGIFIIIFFVLIIASFSVVGSLAMLIIDKRKDIRTLVTFGGTIRLVRSIFVKEGMLIALLGSVGGLILGLAFCLVQRHFGLITIPADTFMVDSYPVVVKWTDIAGVVVAFTAVSYIIAKFTVIKMIPKSYLRI